MFGTTFNITVTGRDGKTDSTTFDTFSETVDFIDKIQSGSKVKIQIIPKNVVFAKK